MDICMRGFEIKDMPSANYVWESYLFSKGFIRNLLPDTVALMVVNHLSEDTAVIPSKTAW